MAKKIAIDRVAEIMKRKELAPSLLREIVEEMQLQVQPEGDEEEKPPAQKKQFCILVSDPDGQLPEKAEFAGWVLQIPEEEAVATTQERIFRAAYEFNTTKRGRLLPSKTVGEALENIPAKHFKEAQVWVKTKEPVLVLRTNNLIPTEETDRHTDRRTTEDAVVSR